MSFVCIICSEDYTANGTEHALYTIMCGHVVGKSCLIRGARENDYEGRFNCPVCRNLVHDGGYHQIYDLSKELLKFKFDYAENECKSEDDIMKRCLLGTSEKESFFFIETGTRELNSRCI
uniref:RING-type domain-containing protein n=1 Tax=Strongyloides venezuelensis TaxID=75913 RepID=A0A0K0FUN9_STRVS